MLFYSVAPPVLCCFVCNLRFGLCLSQFSVSFFVNNKFVKHFRWNHESLQTCSRNNNIEVYVDVFQSADASSASDDLQRRHDSDKMEELLNAASRSVSSKIDLIGGFYTEPVVDTRCRLSVEDIEGYSRIIILL